MNNNPRRQKAADQLYYWQWDRTDSFTDRLFDLFHKADKFNLVRLALGFAEEYEVWQEWYNSPNQDDWFRENTPKLWAAKHEPKSQGGVEL